LNPVSPGRWCIRAALALGFLVVMSGTAEWLTWVNADRYPEWLARQFVADGNETSAGIIKLIPVFEKLCDRLGGFAVEKKDNGMFLRCDNSPHWQSGKSRFTTSLSASSLKAACYEKRPGSASDRHLY
jgi:hypothetical protein